MHNAAANVDYRPINEQGDRFRPMLAWLQDAEEAAHPMAQTPPAIPTPSVIRHPSSAGMNLCPASLTCSEAAYTGGGRGMRLDERVGGPEGI